MNSTQREPLLQAAFRSACECLYVAAHSGRVLTTCLCRPQQVKQYYTAPTLIRSLMGAGEQHVRGHDLSSLQVLGTVGEPINPEAWRWYHEVRRRNETLSAPVGVGPCHDATLVAAEGPWHVRPTCPAASAQQGGQQCCAVH